jgi:hypothetical protein
MRVFLCGSEPCINETRNGSNIDGRNASLMALPTAVYCQLIESVEVCLPRDYTPSYPCYRQRDNFTLCVCVKNAEKSRRHAYRIL